MQVSNRLNLLTKIKTKAPAHPRFLSCSGWKWRLTRTEQTLEPRWLSRNTSIPRVWSLLGTCYCFPYNHHPSGGVLKGWKRWPTKNNGNTNKIWAPISPSWFPIVILLFLDMAFQPPSEGQGNHTDSCSLWALQPSPPNVGFDSLPSTAFKVWPRTSNC